MSTSALLLILLVSGCQTPNFYHARTMPKNLRVVAMANPQEVDLSRLASATGGSDTIGAGDVLEVSISTSLSKDDQVTIPVRIADNGTATIPDIGSVYLAGYEPQAAELLIRGEAVKQKLYPNPTVTVAVAHKKMNRIRVLGAVNEPSLYELPPNASDVVSAIAAAGGLAENAGENVEIRNPASRTAGQRPAVAGDPQTTFSPVSDSTEVTGGMQSYSINLVSAARSGTNSHTIADGGVVMVEKRDPAPLQIQGLVRKPDTYDFPIGKPMTVLGAIAMAGGRSNQVANKVFVIRPLAAAGKRAVIQVSIRAAKRNPREDIVLGPGDIVSVEQTPSTVLLEAVQLIRFGISGSAGLF